MRAVEFLIEKTIIRPDVVWVDHSISTVTWSDDLYVLADALSDAFEDRLIEFAPTKRSYGTGVFKDKLSASVGLAGAEWIGGDPQMVIYLTPQAAKLGTATLEFIARLKELITHELVHANQAKLSRTGKIGSSNSGDAYYADPHEIAAIASEIETQFLRIETDPQLLIKMIQSKDKRLEQSDRYRLHKISAQQDPAQFAVPFKKVIRAVIDRLI